MTEGTKPRQGRHRLVLALALVALLTLGVAACGDDDSGSSENASTDDTSASDGGDAGASDAHEADKLRLGLFPNVTHAPALIGVEEGFIEDNLPEGVSLETQFFNAGGAASEAFLNGGIDATFIGPNPAINAFAQTNGEAVRIVSGSTSGGAFLIVKPGIEDAADLEGKTLATPQLGNTQDVALRTWLAENDLTADESGGGDVSIKPQENADTLTAFQEGNIDGAWVPEPWATRLIQEGGGEVLLDEAELWPEGRYVTTHLIVQTEYLEKNPGIIKGLLTGTTEAITFAQDDAATAQTVVNDAIESATDKRLPDEVISAAWENLEFTVDPIASSLQKSKDDAEAVGLLEPVDLEGIYDLSILNSILAEQDQEEVEGL